MASNNPADLQPAATGIFIVMTILAISLVTVSLLEHRKNLRSADYFSIIALAVAITNGGIVIDLNRDANFRPSHDGAHVWTVPLSSLNGQWVQLRFAQNILLACAMFLAKTAIFLFYLHVFGMGQQMRLAIYAGILFNFVVYFPTIIVIPVSCAPRTSSESWLVAFQAPICQPHMQLFGLIQGVLAVVLDLYIFVLPLPMLAGLNLQKKKKIGVMVVFGTAFLGIVASVTTMVFRIQLYYTDDVRVGAEMFISSMVESFISVIVANMVPAASFFRKNYAALLSPGEHPGWLSPLASMLRMGRRSQKRTSNISATKCNKAVPDSSWNDSGTGLRHTNGTEMYSTAGVVSRPESVASGQIRRTVEVGQTRTVVMQNATV